MGIDSHGFAAVDLRVGTIVAAQPFPEARRASYKLVIDFGPQLGRKNSCAQITHLYSCQVLIGTQVIAAVNLGEKRIAGFASEVLVLGVPGAHGSVVLLRPERSVANGVRVF